MAGDGPSHDGSRSLRNPLFVCPIGVAFGTISVEERNRRPWRCPTASDSARAHCETPEPPQVRGRIVPFEVSHTSEPFDMGQRYPRMNEKHIEFVQAQKIFFVATTAAHGRVNLSPKGMDTLRVLSPERIAWLNVTGSGNETAAHVRADPRMTLMFAAFEGPPMILRLYGTARAIHRDDPEWTSMISQFPPVRSSKCRSISCRPVAAWPCRISISPVSAPS